jgi:hypothetical protein
MHHDIYSPLFGSKSEQFDRIVRWHQDCSFEEGLPMMIRFMKFALHTVHLTMEAWNVINIDFVCLWIKSRGLIRQLLIDPGDFLLACDLGEMCSSAFWRLRSFLVEEFPESKFFCRDDVIEPHSDWKDWFLLDNEFGAVTKYAVSLVL